MIVWPGVSIHVERGETLDSVTQTLAQQPLASSEVSFFIVSPAWPGSETVRQLKDGRLWLSLRGSGR